MRKVLLFLTAFLFAAPSFTADTLSGFAFVKSDVHGRIQVIVDGDDRAYYAGFLFQPIGTVPLLPGDIYPAIVVKSGDRLTIDSQDPPLHLDLYLPSLAEEAVVIGKFPSLRVNGIALRSFRIPRSAGFIQSLSMDELPSMLGAASPDKLTCVGGKVTKDSECVTGGPGSKYAAGFKCPGRQPTSPLMGWTGSAGEAEKQECSDGYYGCGTCTGSPNLVVAKQECRSYECPKPTPSPLPPPDPAP